MELTIYREILDIILSYSSDGILITDSKGKALAYSETYRNYLGASRELLETKTIRDFYNEGWLSSPVIYQVVESKAPSTDFITYYKTNKKILVTGVPVFKNDALEHIILTFRDLSEIKKLEEQLLEQRKLLSKVNHQFQLMKTDALLLTKNRDMLKVEDLIRNVTNHDSPIILFGETGVGKSIFAEKIHNLSNRFKTGQFIKVDCASIPESLLELELFGYEKGAFTDARKEGKEGLIELADKGTLFLDEIGELTLPLQSKLLNVLEDKKIRRIGATRQAEVDVRIISATNQDLKLMIQEKTFRKDLFYRLNVLPITIPPLRERKEDILPLIKHFEKVYTIKYNIEKRISPKACQDLLNYEWPGNVRELMHVVERMLLTDETITLKEIKNVKEEGGLSSLGDILSNSSELTLKEYLNLMEKKYILNIVDTSKTLKEAADKMDIEISTLVRKKQKYNIYKSYQR